MSVVSFSSLAKFNHQGDEEQRTPPDLPLPTEGDPPLFSNTIHLAVPAGNGSRVLLTGCLEESRILPEDDPLIPIEFLKNSYLSLACLGLSYAGFCVAWLGMYLDVVGLTICLHIFGCVTPLLLALQVTRFSHSRLLLVLQKFDFWYLAGTLAVALVTVVAFFHGAGANWFFGVYFAILWAPLAIFIFGQDAAPYEPKNRGRVLLFMALF
jgi:hypothetical protein